MMRSPSTTIEFVSEPPSAERRAELDRQRAELEARAAEEARLTDEGERGIHTGERV
jgi:NADH dehydrogenase